MKINSGRDIPTITSEKKAIEMDVIHFINCFDEVASIIGNNIEVIKNKKRINFHIFEIKEEEVETLKEVLTWRI